MFDAKLKEGVEYFEQMLKVMPDDRTTLEFLAVAYPQMGEPAKAEWALAELARVLLKEGDSEHAAALLPRLEACNDQKAKLMAIRIRANAEPRPELVPEVAQASEPASADVFLEARNSEVKLAEKLGEKEVASQLLAMSDNGRASLVSALYFIERDRSDAFEGVLAKLCDEYREPPVPLEAFTPDRKLAMKLGEELVKTRGVIPFATIGRLVLIAYVSPHDVALKEKVELLLGSKVRFYLALPESIEKAVEVLWPKEDPKS